MPDDRVRATLNDIGTEELAHWEMLGTMIYQSIQGASIQELEAAGLFEKRIDGRVHQGRKTHNGIFIN